jgi:DNA invertase Pin-like site-specific DNA recombinase
MLTIAEIINAKRKKSVKTDETELRSLPYKHAYIYGRLSSHGQVRDNHESIREIGRLVDLAKQDGFHTNLQASEIEKELLEHGGNRLGVWADGEVSVDVRDLGLSGQLSAEKRLGLRDLQRDIEKGIVGTVYLTEGVSRLSRDKDYIVPFKLLQLLKKYKCRIRTPEGVWNPAIERDWEYLKDEFEDAIDELGMMNKRLHRRKAQKAKRGEFVGEPIIPGFILPIIKRKPNGQYEYGKMEPYPPHAEIVIIILQEFIRQGGIVFRTLKALKGLTFPYFPPELSYMERLTSLRACPRQENGYRITPAMIRGLTTNLKLIGVSQWGDGEAILNNHKAAVPEALLLEACQLAIERTKPKGRAANFELMEWSGLLICMKHPEPRLVSGHGSRSLGHDSATR